MNARDMRILVIGSGGREHALVWKLAQSSHVKELFCAPGNAGIAMETLQRGGQRAQCIGIGAENVPALFDFAREKKVDLTVVGPDNPLALGIVDRFEMEGVRIWGPTRKAAQFESSKVFSQRFMEKYGIPTARAGEFSDPKAARQFAASLGGRCVVKADGLALGKGVLICETLDAARRAIDQTMIERQFGDAGSHVVIQELLEGTEISLHALCDGSTAKLFPTSQDHKRVGDGDRGLNTGGMGAYSPAPFLSASEAADLGRRVLEPWLEGCRREGIQFHGILYPGVMLTEAGPRVLEFNARFGDPEAQVYLTRLKNDLVELLEASVDGTLDRVELEWSDSASVCVVIASEGYPESYSKGRRISGLEAAAGMAGIKVFHAGTSRAGDDIVTNGGRVVGVTGLGPDVRAAREAAYAAAAKIGFEGCHYRKDIASKAVC